MYFFISLNISLARVSHAAMPGQSSSVLMYSEPDDGIVISLRVTVARDSGV